MLLHEKIRDAYVHPQFIADVIKPLQIEPIMDQEVSRISSFGVGVGRAGLVSVPLKELRDNILSHFCDGLNIGFSVGKPKNNDLLRKKNTKRVILQQKETRMAEDGEN